MSAKQLSEIKMSSATRAWLHLEYGKSKRWAIRMCSVSNEDCFPKPINARGQLTSKLHRWGEPARDKFYSLARCSARGDTAKGSYNAMSFVWVSALSVWSSGRSRVSSKKQKGVKQTFNRSKRQHNNVISEAEVEALWICFGHFCELLDIWCLAGKNFPWSLCERK